MADYREEDVSNIILLEHVNCQVPDQSVAMLFYVVGLGFTRDPYLTVGLENMWINVGEQQFHLPTRSAQAIPGHIGLVVPDREGLTERLKSLEERLAGTRFGWSAKDDYVAVTCPWGNQFRCYTPGLRFGDMALGLAYVEFLVTPGSAGSIARFYSEAFGADSTIGTDDNGVAGRLKIGRNQSVVFRETKSTIPPYDGHHIAIYVANFSRPYGFLQSRGLIIEEVRNHQFRFKDLIEPETGKVAFVVEHEVRSLHHPMFHRRFVNRDPIQTQRNYKRGRDPIVPFSA